MSRAHWPRDRDRTVTHVCAAPGIAGSGAHVRADTLFGPIVHGTAVTRAGEREIQVHNGTVTRADSAPAGGPARTLQCHWHETQNSHYAQSRCSSRDPSTTPKFLVRCPGLTAERGTQSVHFSESCHGHAADMISDLPRARAGHLSESSTRSNWVTKGRP